MKTKAIPENEKTRRRNIVNMKKYGLAGGAILVVMALVLIAGPLAAIAQGLPAGASIVDLEPVPPPEREVDVARRAGQAWVDKIPSLIQSSQNGRALV
ncbi:hypothetical protein M1N50_02995 [Dehalococcoidia bacterium]|nr:hypothetical protein [Dehalococcoidia bacterium]